MELKKLINTIINILCMKFSARICFVNEQIHQKHVSIIKTNLKRTNKYTKGVQIRKKLAKCS